MNEPSKTGGWLTLLAVLCVCACCLVWSRRAASVWRAAGIEPGVAVTSGCEEASFNSLWRYTHDQPVYSDSARIPFAASYFNGLFYASYGAALRPFVARQGGAAVVVGGRVITLCGAVAGVLALLALGARASPAGPAVRAAVALFVFSGPLVGWWAFTVRPDVWALALECLGTAVLLTTHSARNPAGILAAAVLFFLAWSFKQTCICGAAAAVLFLLARRQRGRSLAFALVVGLLVLVSLSCLGAEYRMSMADLLTRSRLIPGNGLPILADALVKTAPLSLLAAPALCRLVRSPGAAIAGRGGDLLLFGALGLATSLPFSFLAACKDGAASNYFFTTGLMLGLVALSGGADSRLSRAAVLAALAAAAAEQGACSLGWVGTIDLGPQAEELRSRWQAWRPMEEPRFSEDRRLNLPWLSRGGPAFVLAFNYMGDRQRGRAFQADGVGGLIRSGYFRSLLLKTQNGASFDGASLGGYVAIQQVGNYTLYERARPPGASVRER